MASGLKHFDWNRARAFLVTAQQGSLSAAARELGTTQPTVGRQIEALERELNTSLFERVPHGLELTEAGLALLSSVENMGAAAEELSLRASGQAARLEGPVCISATELQATFELPPIIERIRRDYPGIQLEIVVANEASNLRRRDADIALRNFRPTQPDLIAKKIRDDDVWLYGSKAYLSRIEAPCPREQAVAFDLIAYERSESNLSLLRNKGLVSAPVNMPIISQNYHMQLALVEQGLGLGIFVEPIAKTRPTLSRAFVELGPLTRVPLWLVCHKELRTSLPVRTVFDGLVAGLQAN